MSLIYDDIIENLISGEIGKYVPEGVAHSFPIFGQESGKIVDCFFLFSYSYGKGEFNSPIARLALDSISKELVYYQDSNTNPFEKDSEPHSYPLEFKHSKDERRVAIKKYQDYYISVREFAFSKELNASQIDVLMRYMKTFNMVVSTNMKPFYIALSPVFFEWMTTILKPRQ